jgi:sugar phosphate isomerase/epimerase
MEDMPIGDAIARAKADGYEGIETTIWNAALVREVDEEIPLVLQVFPLSAEELLTALEEARPYRFEKATVHAGKDHWSDAEAEAFFDAALAGIRLLDIEVNFETHRGRLLYTPNSTRHFLARHPDLHLCADFSHWTCVCGSLLHDQDEALEAAIQRTRHLHARVGHEEGPQVPDPSSPRWARKTARFFEIWDRVVAANPNVTVVPEFGPPNYQWTDPADGRPLADLYEVCRWTRDQLRDRWSSRPE